MHNYLIPGHYLKLAARRHKDIDRKWKSSQKSQDLLSIVNCTAGYCDVISDCKIKELEKSAKSCAQLFQRSSSCVEGRNAQLSLRHQGMHRLSDQKLKALTVIHNYYLKRPDGSTAAERFYENKPIDMFEWLLGNMASPSRPRRKTKLAA